MNRQELRARDAKAFRNNAQVYEQEQQARRQPVEVNPLDRVRSGGSAPPFAEARKKGGGLFGKLKDLGGDALDVGKDVGIKALEVAEVPAKYTLRPLMGAAAYLGAEQKIDPNTGKPFITTPTWREHLSGFKELATQNPIDSYREGKQAFEARMRDPELNAGGRVLLGAASDPLTFVGPGAVKAGLRAAPAAVQASRGARVAGAVLESPRMASVGGVVGAAGAAQMAENADLSPGWQTAATLAGGVVGGVAGGSGAARQALKGKGPLRGMGGSVVEDASGGIEPSPRAPVAAVGEPPVQAVIPGMEKPIPPERAKPPLSEFPTKAGVGGTQPFGSKPPVDLLNTRSRRAMLEEGEARAGSKWQQVPNDLRSLLGRLAGVDATKDPNVTTKVEPYARSRGKIKDQIANVSTAMIDRERRVLKASGIEVKPGDDGYWHMIAGDQDLGFFDDVVERTSEAGRAAFDSLDEQQQAALAVVGEHNQMLNGTIRFHGGEPRIDPEIEGDYFGRRVTGKAYESMGGTKLLEKQQGTIASRKVGAERMKSRVMENVEQLAEKGYATENPWEARLAITRGKLMTAEDEFLASGLKPLRVKEPAVTMGLGQVSGHPAFQESWFEPQVAKAIQKTLDGPKGPPAVIQKVNSWLTPLRASLDISATFQQGQRLWLSDPAHAGQYFAGVSRSIAQPDFYDGILNKLDFDGPGIVYQTQQGLRFTGESSVDEMLFPVGGSRPTATVLDKARNVAAKPFEWSNQHFGRTLNVYRLHMANSAYKRFVDAGLSGDALDEAMRLSNEGTNRSFGWSTSTPTTLEQAALFAPRYFRASVETVGKAIEGTIKLGHAPIDAKMARNHLALMLSEGTALVWALNTARGYETEFDPRSTNFLRIRNVGGLDVSPFGTYSTLFKAIAQTVAGDEYGTGRPDPGAVGRLVEGKLSPALAAAYWPAKGETYLGKPLEPLAGPEGLAGAVGEQVKSSLPFGIQTLINEGPGAAAVGSMGLTNTPVTPSERRDFRRDEVAKERFGASYADLPGGQKAQVNEDAKIRKDQADADKNTLTREDDRSKSTGAALDAAKKLDALSAGLEAGQMTGDEWRKQYQTIQAELRGGRDVLKIDGKKDAVLEGWFGLYDRAEGEDGRINYDLLDSLQAEYRAKNPGIDEKVDRVVGAHDNATVREYREASELAQEYYSIPAYRGLSAEDSEKASRILMAASDLVSFGKARDKAAALRMLRQVDAEGVRLAQTASRRGTNPARAKWRKDPAHALYAKFYSDAPIMAGD